MNDRMPDGTPFFICDAEREFIGAALLCESADVLAVTLDRNDFRDKHLGVIWAAIVKGASEGNPGIVNTAWHLNRAEVLDRVGAETFLVELAGRALVEQHFPHLTLRTHPVMIKEWALRRRGLERAGVMAQQAMKGNVRVPVWERPEYQGELA